MGGGFIRIWIESVGLRGVCQTGKSMGVYTGDTPSLMVNSSKRGEKGVISPQRVKARLKKREMFLGGGGGELNS